MSLTDPLGDMLTRIRNAYGRNKSNCLTPASRLRARVLDVLKSEGYIRDYSQTDFDNGKSEISIELKYFDGKPVVREISRVSIDHPAVVVGQVAFVEHLEQDVEHVRVRLLDLVQEDDRVGLPAHSLGQRAELLVPDVARRGTDEPADRELLHVLGHVHPDERLSVGKEELRQGPRQLGLADSGGAGEDERSDRAVGVLEAGARAPDGARHRHDRLVLADHRGVDLIFHPQQPRGLGLLAAG